MTKARAALRMMAARDLPSRWWDYPQRQPMLVAAVAIFVAFSMTSDVFSSAANISNILRQTAPILILGLGMMLVALVGGIDLSVGSTVLAAATASGIALTLHLGSSAAIVAALAVGIVVGAINGLLIEAFSISPVIVTLGSLIAVRGVALVALGHFHSWIWINAPLFNALARNELLGLPADAVVALVLLFVLWIVLRRALLGRRLYAIGDNPVAARLCGVPVRRLRMVAYIGCSACAGIAGVVTAARTGIVSPSIGLGMEFFAIAVVALGAGGLPAGRVRLGQPVVGAIILTMVFNYMTIRGVAGTWQTTATGGLLLAAIVLGRLAEGAPESASAPAGIVLDAETAGIGAALGRSAIVAVTVLAALVFAWLVPSFASGRNLLALIEQNAVVAIVAVGAMIGIISRAIDISSGSVVALGAVVAALAYATGAGALLSLGAGAFGTVCVYAVNGLLVGGLGLDALIVTLAAWIWARGLAVSLTGARTIGFDADFVGFMNAPLLGGFTPPVLLVPIAFAAGWLILVRLPIGLRLYALGHDPALLRQAGVSVGRVRFAAFLLIGGFTAVGMVLMLSRLGAAAPTAGFGLELDAIVAVVIGGTSFRGGEGRLRDTAIGVAFLAVLNNGLSGLQMGDAQFFLVKGCAILGALCLRSLGRSWPAWGAL